MTRIKNTLTHHWHHSWEMCVFSFSCVFYTNFISPACFHEIRFFFLSLFYLFFFNFKMLRFENKYVNPNLLGFLDSWLCTSSSWVEGEVNYKWGQMCIYERGWVGDLKTEGDHDLGQWSRDRWSGWWVKRSNQRKPMK